MRVATRGFVVKNRPDHPSQPGVLVANYHPGDEIAPEHLELINPKQLDKLSEDTDAPEPTPTAEPEPVVADDVAEDGLEDLKIADLKDIIQSEQIEFHGTARKSNLVQAIRDHRAG